MKSKKGFTQDRFTQGLIAGMIGWIPEIIFTWIMFGLHVGKFKYSDIAGVLAWGSRPQGLLEELFAEFIMFSLLATMAGVFAMLLKVISDDSILIKGAIFGGATWFLIYTAINLFKVTGIFGKVNFGTAVSNMLGAVIWGLVTAWMLSILNRKFGVNN
jgi:hypothetical protein